jgi:hypothetical protein
MSKADNDKFATDAEHALQEAVADAIEEHRRAGKPIVVARDGKPVRVDPNTVRTVREERAEYGTEQRNRAPKQDRDESK